MSKIKFGNFITYRGKNLKTPQAKAVNGNLVFAEITEGADQGYYIFGGVAEGHLVTMEVFNAVKKEVKELIGAGELAMPKHDDGTYYSIVEYVNSRLTTTLADYKVKDVVVGATSIAVDGIVTLGDAAQRNVATEIATGASGLATAGQVADAISGIKLGATALSSYEATGVIGATGSDNKLATEKAVRDAISTLGTVMEFKGVVTGDDLPDAANFSKGDIIIWKDEEYVLDEEGVWCEIGKVKSDEAVLTLSVNQGSTGYITLNGVTGLNGQYSGYVTAGLNVVESDLMKTEGDDLNQLVSAAAVKEAISNIPAATVTGATGYLKVENKNVVVDAAQVELGATGTSTKLVTLGYVEDQLESISNDINDAKKHSSVVSKSDYIGVTGVTTENGSVEYQVSLKANALNAANHSISEIKIDGEAVTTAATVQEALQDLFKGDKTAAEGLTDLNDRLEAHIGSTQAHAAEHITYAGATGVTGVTATNVEEALDDLYSRVEAAALSGDAKNITYTAGTGVVTGAGVDKVNEALDDLYTQLAALDGAAIKDVVGDAYVGATTAANKNGDLVTTLTTVLADVVDTSDIEGYAKAEAKGLATDAYVQDYVAYSLAWEVLAD